MNFDINIDATLKKDVLLSNNQYDFRITDFTVDTEEYKHLPKAYEIFTVMSGEGILKHGTITYNISAGDVFFFHDGDPYRTYATNDNLSIKVIGFSNSFYGPFNERVLSFFDIPYNKRKIYTHISEEEFPHFLYVLSTLEQHTPFFNTYNRLSIITIINFILMHYMVVTDGTISNRNYQDDVGKVLRYIYDQFRSQEFSISQMAKKLHFTPTYLSKIFKREIGTSIQLYVLNLRLEFAADLLVGTELSISEIASASGFNSPSYFIKQFKRKYNVTPKKYACELSNEK